MALKKASCGLALVALKRAGCDVWQTECQASNVTANVQSDHILHGYMLPVLFATDQLHRPPRSAEIQPMLQQDAFATRPYRGLEVEMCGNGLQHSNSLPFPSVHSHSQSHSHEASDLIPIPVLLPKFIPISSHSHSHPTNERHSSLNNQTMINVQNPNTQLP